MKSANFSDFFDPLPPCHCHTHATYQYSRLLLRYPIPGLRCLIQFQNYKIISRRFVRNPNKKADSPNLVFEGDDAAFGENEWVAAPVKKGT